VSRARRKLIVAAVVALTVAAAAFALASPQQASSSLPLPACAHAQRQIKRPGGLRAFPLPAGAVLDHRAEKYGYTFVTGAVPGAINPVRDFLVSRLSLHGYRLGAGDSEANEAEAAFAGHGLRGRFKVRAAAGCPGALTVAIAVRSARE
jgi:hypothetical protein